LPQSLPLTGHLRRADAGKHWNEPWCVPLFIIFVDATTPLYAAPGEHYRRLSDNRLINT
jgi:hypothetical protein